MKHIANWSIKVKVMAAFTLVLAAAIALGLFGIQRLATLNGEAADVRDHWLPT
jgi:methyl-accepting chemotaxis protein